MPAPLHIAHRPVGPGHRAFVISEIGVNHDGSLATALRLVTAARAAGADSVKLQLFRAERLLNRTAELAAYQRSAGARSAAELLRKYELSDEATAELVAAIRNAGMIPLATPFSPEDVVQIARLGLPAIKLASPDLVNPLLTDAAADLGLPLLLSTGAATPAEIDWAVARLHGRGASFALLHCVSAYPTPADAAAVAAVGALRDRYGVPVGYSDHTQTAMAGALAVACGACIVEKHLTHDRAATGPDHAASADPEQFRQYVSLIRQAESMLGDGRKQLQNIEADVRRVSRQSLVARRDIPAGKRLERADLTCQRPGTGIGAMELDAVIGQLVLANIAAGAMLKPDDLSRALAA